LHILASIDVVKNNQNSKKIIMKLEEIRVDSLVRGILPNSAVTIKHVQMFGNEALEVTYVDGEGKASTQLLFRDQEPILELVLQTRPLSFTADGHLFRLASEAQRLSLAFLFDPLIAVNTSSIDPLPHQITAVYETMLNRQPLRFLLADDPGAGKTIMAGLLIKELIIRGDVARCLIIAPGSLAEQWQDELDQKFNLQFDILTNEGLQAARTGNWFQEHSLCLCRLDKLSRNEDVQDKLVAADWDLVVVDEAHKMSASYFGGEMKPTKRFKLGRRISAHTRQLLLLTATPHNGKEQDFHFFLSLLDGDRFEGKPRDAAHTIDASDIMRRMVKEQLVTMEGKPLFPDRFAYTVPYNLSPEEAILYKNVTEYVCEQFNRADNLDKDRRGTVGFALTILQRRLASSPEAIFQSLRRRRERLEDRLREEKLLRRGAAATQKLSQSPELEEDDIDDLEDAPEQELETAEEQIVDQATAALTIAELEEEIRTLRGLESEAAKLKRSGNDTKWKELSEGILENPEMFDASKNRRKLVIFTEHRDTLNYLTDKLSLLLGNPNHVVTIHGQTPRERRRQIQESFEQDPEVLILVATDAASEGINLHRRAHLMVNYDLPWNPNRIEQRFGRIHRIGQPERCHLWNLVAIETREGHVFHRLLEKLSEQRKALGGAVFDVLGKMFKDRSLRELLIEAIREGNRPEVKAKLDQVIDAELDVEHLRGLIEDRYLVHESLSTSRVRELRDQMDRAQARKLQPHYVGSFFEEAFKMFGGQLLKREPRRFEIRRVPADIRLRDRIIGTRAPVLNAYERVTFHKGDVRLDGKPPAALVAPGHPLLDATIDLVLERHRDTLRQGAVLVDTTENGTEPRILFFLEHSITDGRKDSNKNPLTISRQLQFVEITRSGQMIAAGYAPYLDYTPATPEQFAAVQALFNEAWLGQTLEQRALGFAIQKIVPPHLEEVRTRREAYIQKVMQQVKARLTSEINYWDHRANVLKAQEDAGKSRSNINSGNARRTADELADRLKRRLAELDNEKSIVARPPNVLGGALVVPASWFANSGQTAAMRETPPPYGAPDREVERLAMEKVMQFEREQGFVPRDISAENRGYDIESRDPKTDRLRFIEVKGRVKDAVTVTVTKNELLTSLNRPEGYVLAIVFVASGAAETPIYLRQPFSQEPEFGTASVNFKLSELLSKAAAQQA
jgi:SNF2 family DNA or RNA helicase